MGRGNDIRITPAEEAAKLAEIQRQIEERQRTQELLWWWVPQTANDKPDSRLAQS